EGGLVGVKTVGSLKVVNRLGVGLEYGIRSI
ncbi:unnamed protein product, partial [marine sediment metagenome]